MGIKTKNDKVFGEQIGREMFEEKQVDKVYDDKHWPVPPDYPDKPDVPHPHPHPPIPDTKRIDILERQVMGLKNNIGELTRIIVDLKDQVNRVMGGGKMNTIINELVANSESFERGDDGKIVIKTGGGINIDENGSVVINAGDSLVVDSDTQKLDIDFGDTLHLSGEGEDLKLEVNYDKDNLSVIDGKLSVSADTWQSE